MSDHQSDSDTGVCTIKKFLDKASLINNVIQGEVAKDAHAIIRDDNDDAVDIDDI